MPTMIPLVCPQCNNDYEKEIKFFNRSNKLEQNHFCSSQCSSKFQTTTGTTQVLCVNCNAIFIKRNSQVKRSPNHFCSSSCAGIYNNKNKTHSFCRSKLEFYLEKQLKSEMPNVLFLANSRKIVGYELDLYFPDLKLAIEINGPFHYKPIFGDKKLSQVQAIDKLKQVACVKANIDFIVIDNLKKFSDKFANPIWLEIKAILNKSI